MLEVSVKDCTYQEKIRAREFKPHREPYYQHNPCQDILDVMYSFLGDVSWRMRGNLGSPRKSRE